MISHSLFKLLKIYARKQPGTEVYYYMTLSTRIKAGTACLFLFVIHKTMTISFKVGVSNLFTEILTHTKR